MVSFGYKLMAEEHDPRALVRNAVRAEAAGFDFVGISDHYHPWLAAQGHSSFAWSVLGAIAHATARVGIATGLTCPIMRYHPAIVAQAAATVAVMSGGRFTLAIGAGERLNEHIVGRGWPGVAERHAMLSEAIDIIRLLWEGGTQSYDGLHYTLEAARVWDLPETPIPLVMGISGPQSAALAASQCDGMMAVEPKGELVKLWREAGGNGPRYGEVALAVAPSREEGLKLAHARFRFGALGWPVMAELPNVRNFESATQFVRPEDLAIPAGPDIGPHVEAVKAFVDAGFDHIALTGVGPDQDGFIAFFESELGPALRQLR